jgi:hypothetical protein
MRPCPWFCPYYKKSSLHQIAWATAIMAILGGGWGGN